MNENLNSRLINWKFESALKYLDGEDQDTKELVMALSRTLGNSGWLMGDIATIVGAAMEAIEGIDFGDDRS